MFVQEYRLLVYQIMVGWNKNNDMKTDSQIP